MVGAAEADQVSARGVIAREPHRLHDGLGAGHVEGDFIQAGNLQQAPHVVGGHGMVCTQHRPQAANPLGAAFDALLVEIVAEHVDAVRTGQIVQTITVQIGDGHAGGGLDEVARLEVFAHVAAELEGHAITGSELQIGNGAGDFGGQISRLLEAPGKHGRQPHEAGTPCRRDAVGCPVGAEELRLVVFVERHQRRKAARHARMPRQRAVLGPRQLQPNLQFAQQDGEHESGQYVQERRFTHRFPRMTVPGAELYCRRVTLR